MTLNLKMLRCLSDTDLKQWYRDVSTGVRKLPIDASVGLEAAAEELKRRKIRVPV